MSSAMPRELNEFDVIRPGGLWAFERVSGSIPLSSRTQTSLPGFSAIAIPGALGTGRYLIEFLAGLSATAPDFTSFTLHFGPRGDSGDREIDSAEFDSSEIRAGSVLMRAVVDKPTAADRISLAYCAAVGSCQSVWGVPGNSSLLTIEEIAQGTN